MWNILDFLTIASSFVGHHTAEDVNKYFLAIRALKVIFLIRDVPDLSEEMGIFMNSFKKASFILVPALCLIYVFTIVGLYSFLGIQSLT